MCGLMYIACGIMLLKLFTIPVVSVGVDNADQVKTFFAVGKIAFTA